MSHLPDISTLLLWGPPEPSSNGTMVRKAVPTKRFWELWKTEQTALADQGVVVRQQNGIWLAFWAPDTIQPIKVAPRPISAPNLALPETVVGKLRDYQIKPVQEMIAQINQYPRILNGSDMGTGKTYCALAVCATLGLNPVAICRIAAKPAWEEVAEYFGLKITLMNLEKLKMGKTDLGSWDPFDETEFHWTLPENSLLIIDEVHACGAIDGSLNSFMLKAVRDQGLHAIALSASAASSPLKMRALGYFLGLHDWFDYYPWLYRHGCSSGEYGFEFNCGMNYGEINSPLRGMGQGELERRQQEIMGRIHANIFAAGKGVRVRKADIPNFPKTTIIPRRIQFDTAKINKVYAEMEEELATLATKEKGDRKKSERVIMTRARQRTELLKVPGIITEIEEAIEEGMSVAIFVNYKETVKALAERLKTDCLITGDQSPAEKKRAMDDFNSNRSRKMVLNSQAGGESIGIHCIDGVHARKAIIFPSFWAESILQCLGRVDRDGGKLPSFQEIPFAAGTIEERAYFAFCSKLKNIQSFNGDINLTDFDLR